MEKKHSPLPYKIEGKSHYTRDIERHVVDVRLTMYSSARVAGDTQEQAEENAAFIVRACNNHYKLVEALKAAEWFLDKRGYGQGELYSRILTTLAESEAA